jgi:hypothetical protein
MSPGGIRTRNPNRRRTPETTLPPGSVPRAIAPRKEPRYTLNRMLCGLQSGSGHYGEMSRATAGMRTQGDPAHSSVVIPTTLTRCVALLQ